MPILQKKRINNNLICDMYFIFCINIITYLQTTGLLPSILIRLGANTLSFIFIFPLFLYSISKAWNKIKKQPFFIITAITIIYVIFTFLKSYEKQGFFETYVNFRYSFINIFIFFFACFYLYSIPYHRIIIIIKALLIITLIQAFFFCGHALGIFHFFSGNIYMIEGTRLLRSYLGFPPLLIFSLSTFYMLYILKKERKYIIFCSFLLITVFLSYTRSTLITIILAISIITLLSIFKRLLSLKKIISFIPIATIFILSIIIFFPSSLSYWEMKIDNTINSELKENEGTYAFRQKLIEDALYNNKLKNTQLTGIGYIRDSEKGEYSIVQGTDTYIAPVLYCEGIIGITLRILIILTIIYFAIIYYWKFKNKWNICICTLIISLILIEIPNYIQTPIFMRYSITPLALIMLTRIYKLKTDEKNN